MGINRNSLKLLLHSKRFVDFKNTLTIGKQSLFLNKKELESLLPNRVLNESSLVLSDYLFKSFGAETIDSLDVSDYEGATILQDMNKPIPENLKNKFSVVFDGGSLEHIFNIPVALKNCMDLLKTGGHFIGITPTNNFVGHGFYQFSPELFYSVFCEKYGFKMLKMYFFIDGKYTNFYEVANPQKVHDRVILANSYPSYLFILAEKVSADNGIELCAQQSDYQNITWNTKGDTDKKNRLRYLNRKFIQFRSLMAIFHPLGTSNRKHYKKIKLNVSI